MTRTKILYVIGSLDLGGTERHISLVAPRLRQLGWKPEVYCISRRGVLADDLEKSGVRVIGPPIESNQSATSSLKLLRLVLASVKLFGILLFRRPRIVHFFLPMAYIIGAPLALLTRTPILVMSRRSLNHYQDHHPTLARIERRLHHSMSAVLANSRSVVKELVEHEKCEPRRVILIYNGIDVDAEAVSSTKSTEDSPGLTLITVANLIPYKGHGDLLEALGSIRSKLPKKWTLLCVGRDDGIGKELVQQAARLELDSHIRFLGERTDVCSLLNAADIGLLCSHEEGFSNAILEGMRAGLPMIVTDVGGNAEAIVNSQTGILVPPRDPPALASAIITLAENRALRDRMGQAGRMRVREQFSLDTCIERYHRLYLALDGGQIPVDAAQAGASTQ